jgi:hypothetical protein
MVRWQRNSGTYIESQKARFRFALLSSQVLGFNAVLKGVHLGPNIKKGAKKITEFSSFWYGNLISKSHNLQAKNGLFYKNSGRETKPTLSSTFVASFFHLTEEYYLLY